MLCTRFFSIKKKEKRKKRGENKKGKSETWKGKSKIFNLLVVLQIAN